MMTFLLVAIAALPGLASWWWGRRLIGRQENPALAERYLAMHPGGPYQALMTSVLLGLASLPLLVIGIRRAREHPDEQSDGVWPLAITCGVATAVHWSVLVFMSTADDGIDSYRLGYLLFWAPSAVLLPLAAATALFFVRERPDAVSSSVRVDLRPHWRNRRESRFAESPRSVRSVISSIHGPAALPAPGKGASHDV